VNGKYLIDTNVVSDYLSASFPTAGMELMDKAIDGIPNISIITQIELLCWKTNEITTQNVKDFIADSVVLDITPDVISHCVNLRKRKKIKTPDAIIAATALGYGYTIITNNEKDFDSINGLKLANPHKM
jgi:predicted nucleic acid-binding protein